MSVDSDIILEYQLNSGNKNREVMDKFEGVGAYELVCVYMQVEHGLHFRSFFYNNYSNNFNFNNKSDKKSKF
jgi:hypothetical protein